MIEPNRISIRPITENDTELIVKWRNQTDVRKYFFFRETFTEEMHQEWLKEKVKTGQVVQFIIELGGVPIGSTYLKDIDNEDGTAEYGVFIGEASARGRGVGSEALRLTLLFAKNICNMRRIWARVMEGNVASEKVFLNNRFEVVSRIYRVKCTDGEAKNMIVLEKVLD